MEMTFQQYIDNPMGKKNAVFSQREMFKKFYTDKFDTVFLREAGKINYMLYRDEKKDRYYIHIKIPSETVKKFYYDAVIMFYTDAPEVHSANTLDGYNVKFFSNDPAFVFTYLHVFLDNNLFFEDMKPKASKLAIKKEAKIKNPYGVPGYSKILYFAFLFMKNKNLFNKYAYNGAPVYSVKALLANVEHADKKIADRQEQGEKQAKQERKEKQKEREVKRTTIGDTSSGNIKSTKMTGRIGNIGTVGGVKRTSSVKTSKRTKKK